MSEADSWDDEPGVPSATSSPVHSHTGSSTDIEEEELVSEFRELYKSLNATTTEHYSYSLESLDSFEDVDKLKERLHCLKSYVFELKESYDQLLKAFSMLELGAKQQTGDLEKSLADKLAQLKSLSSQLTSLQSQLHTAQSQLLQVQEHNDQLAAENAELAGHNTRLLQRVRDGEVVSSDLKQLLGVVSVGLGEGCIKLSELSLQSQAPPFPLSDLAVAQAGAVEAERRALQAEISTLKLELEIRLKETGQLREELHLLRAELETTKSQLAELDRTRSEKSNLELQLNEARTYVGGLESEVSSLTQQLREALDRQANLSKALEETREAMELYQTTARQEVEHRDQELSQLTVELATLEQRRKALEEQVANSESQVGSLETARQLAQEEIGSLQEEVSRLEGAVADTSASEGSLQESLVDKETELEAVRQERDELANQLGEKIKELQAQIQESQTIKSQGEASLQDYKEQLSTLTQLHSSCQSEADELRGLLEGREGELSRMITSLQVAAAQIAALDGRERSPGAVSRELSQCEEVCAGIQGELVAHRKSWEDCQATTEQHKSTIEQLNLRGAQLEADVAAQQDRVLELERLLNEVESSRNSMSQTVSDYEEGLASLQAQLDSTKLQYQQSCDEMADLKDRLGTSTEALEEKEQLLVTEVEKRDALITTLESEESVLKQRCQDATERAQISSKARDALQQEYERVCSELEGLGEQVAASETRGAQEVERCHGLIEELKTKLVSSEEQRQTASQEASAAKDELAVLREEQASLAGQLALREDVLEQLTQQTATLKEHYQEALDDVSREQEEVDRLQEELASAQGLSDGLQQEVGECEEEIRGLQEGLHASEQDREALQQQVIDLQSELASLSDQLSAEKQHSLTQVRTGLEALQELSDLKSQLSESQANNESMERALGEGRAENAELARKFDELERSRESLLFQTTTNEATITSLRKQLAAGERALSEATQRRAQAETNFDELQSEVEDLQSRLANSEDGVGELQNKIGLVEEISQERLDMITSLTSQLEEERVRSGLVDELGEQIALLEQQLVGLQNKNELMEGRALEADRACVAMETTATQQQSLIRELQTELSRVRSEEVGGLNDEVADLEEQLARLQTELDITKDECLSLQSKTRSTAQQESHWSRELATTSSQLQLAEERVSVLEGEGRAREARVRELEARLEAAQKISATKLDEAMDSRSITRELEKQLSDKQQDLLHLQHLLDCCRGDLDSARRQLTTSEEDRRGVLGRVALLENEISGLRTEQRGEDSVRIRELESTVSELQVSNQELRGQLVSHDMASGDSSTSLGGQPSITRLRAQVDVDITTGSAEVVTTTTSVPLTFDSQYRAALEKGLAGGTRAEAVRLPGSETESEAALDKDYWLKRAGELSVQLQQSSDYWTRKVRELSIELEKCKQAHRQ